MTGIVSCCTIGLFGWMYLQSKQAMFNLLDQQARSLLQQILVTRSWVADHEGLFLKKLPGVESNSFLPGPDIKDAISGQSYVFRNPAMVTREISEYADRAGKYRFRLTSLDLVNPANAPTPFERQALEEFQARGFEKSRDGIGATGVEQGEMVYSRIIPLVIEPSCLLCHAQQGYRVGDVRGALNVILPMEQTLAALRDTRWHLVVAGVALVGVMLAVLGVLIHRMVLQPIGHLHQVACRLQEGEYGSRAQLATGDELEDLATAFNEMTDRIKRGYEGTIKALVSAVDARDPYTRDHSARVAAYAVAIGRQMGWNEDQLAELELGAILHDVGKIGIRDNILQKPERLVRKERAAMEFHPEKGVTIIKDSDFLSCVIPCILHHHERFDGAGYPDGLHGVDLPLTVRILAVADTFDAMTTDRPYRQALSREEAVTEITRCAGSQFDPEVVDAFLHVYETMDT